MKRLLEALRRRLRPLGELPSARDVHGEMSICVLLSTGGRERVIGSLSKQGDQFVFEYDPAYAASPDAKPISAFPDLHKTYRDERLWPLFAVRVPEMEREDVREAMGRRGIAEDDILRLLGELSKKAVASPYRFAPHCP